MVTKKKKFKSEAEEVAFWEAQEAEGNLTEEHGWEVTGEQFKARTKPISLRLPESLIEEYKVEARTRGIGYQTFMRMQLVGAMTWKAKAMGVPKRTASKPAAPRSKPAGHTASRRSSRKKRQRA